MSKKILYETNPGHFVTMIKCLCDDDFLVKDTHESRVTGLKKCTVTNITCQNCKEHMVIRCDQCKGCTATYECPSDYIDEPCSCGGNHYYIGWKILKTVD
jgi:hypothetical protein